MHKPIYKPSGVQVRHLLCIKQFTILSIRIMENEEYRMPRIGDIAPSFKASSTQGTINFPEDFEGKWVILFSHPADFTPICTTEFMQFAHMAPDFAALNCQLLGLSIGGLSSHIAWLRTIKEKIEYKGMKNVEVGFPLIDDLRMEVARKYGMIHPEASETFAVRAVFFIDPKHVIRAIIYYPMQLGRNFEEIKRVLIGLQTIDAFKIALPADWQPGDDIITSAPSSFNDAQNKMAIQSDGSHCYDWFFCVKPLPIEQITEKLNVSKDDLV